MDTQFDAVAPCDAFPADLKEVPDMLSSHWPLFLHSLAKLLQNHTYCVESSFYPASFALLQSFAKRGKQVCTVLTTRLATKTKMQDVPDCFITSASWGTQSFSQRICSS